MFTNFGNFFIIGRENSIDEMGDLQHDFLKIFRVQFVFTVLFCSSGLARINSKWESQEDHEENIRFFFSSL